jgi:hypothetical protein
MKYVSIMPFAFAVSSRGESDAAHSALDGLDWLVFVGPAWHVTVTMVPALNGAVRKAAINKGFIARRGLRRATT